MIILAKKDLGIDSNTLLKKEAQTIGCNIDGENNRIVVTVRHVLLDKSDNVLTTLKTFSYIRFDKQEVKNEEGEIVEPSNLKIQQLRENPVGKGIEQMLQLDLDSTDGTEESLKQN